MIRICCFANALKQTKKGRQYSQYCLPFSRFMKYKYNPENNIMKQTVQSREEVLVRDCENVVGKLMQKW